LGTDNIRDNTSIVFWTLGQISKNSYSSGAGFVEVQESAGALKYMNSSDVTKNQTLFKD